jgi:hypothetical protein
MSEAGAPIDGGRPNWARGPMDAIEAGDRLPPRLRAAAGLGRLIDKSITNPSRPSGYNSRPCCSVIDRATAPAPRAGV